MWHDVDDRQAEAADGRYGRVSYDAVTGKASGAFASCALADLLELEPREAEERYARSGRFAKAEGSGSRRQCSAADCMRAFS